MEICRPSCVNGMVQADFGNACDLTTKKGGIPRLTFLVCDPTYEHPYAGGWTNLQNVEAAICAGILFFSGKVLGQKPKGSFTKKRINSCDPEMKQSGTKTVTFMDYNSDAEELTEYDFWRGIDANTRFLYFGYITCDDRWYQIPGHFDMEIDEVIEDNSDGNSMIDGTITYLQKDLQKPLYVEGLLAFLDSFTVDGNCYGYYGE